MSSTMSRITREYITLRDGVSQRERAGGEEEEAMVSFSLSRIALESPLTKRSCLTDTVRWNAIKFLVPVRETLQALLEQEDTDEDFKITVDDGGPKVFDHLLISGMITKLQCRFWHLDQPHPAGSVVTNYEEHMPSLTFCKN